MSEGHDEWDVTPVVVPQGANWQSQLERVVYAIAVQLKEDSTLFRRIGVDSGEDWPHAYCPVNGCEWCIFDVAEHPDVSLSKHLDMDHKSMFADAQETLHPCPTHIELCMEAIKMQQQRGVPKVGATVDRQAHKKFAKLYAATDVQALVCFCCARVLVSGEVEFTKPFQHDRQVLLVDD